jgi:hypothetical protein
MEVSPGAWMSSVEAQNEIYVVVLSQIQIFSALFFSCMFFGHKKRCRPGLLENSLHL